MAHSNVCGLQPNRVQPNPKQQITLVQTDGLQQFGQCMQVDGRHTQILCSGGRSTHGNPCNKRFLLSDLIESLWIMTFAAPLPHDFNDGSAGARSQSGGVMAEPCRSLRGLCQSWISVIIGL